MIIIPITVTVIKAGEIGKFIEKNKRRTRIIIPIILVILALFFWYFAFVATTIMRARYLTGQIEAFDVSLIYKLTAVYAFIYFVVMNIWFKKVTIFDSKKIEMLKKGKEENDDVLIANVMTLYTEEMSVLTYSLLGGFVVPSLCLVLFSILL